MIPRKKAGTVATAIASIAILAFIVLAFVASPLLALLVGMAIGYILEVFTGDYVVLAFNAVGLSGVQDGDLPKVFGLIAVVAALFSLGVGNAQKKKTTD